VSAVLEQTLAAYFSQSPDRSLQEVAGAVH